MTEQDQLLQNLIENCTADSAKAFFRRKNNYFKTKNEPLENSDPEKFSNVWKIGRLDFEGDNVVFAFAEVKAELSERSCRKAQFEAARKILRSENADAGLFIFKGANGAFRLSLVYKAYKGTKAELSPYRRFTYFVSPDSSGNTTFKRQVGGCPFDSLEAIKKSFSLEPVNKEFYSKIQQHFYGLVGGKVEKADYTGCMSLPSLPITEPENHKAYQEFAVRLLGRVVFCWFLKHKRCDQNRPLIPHELLSSEAVEAHSGYYHAVLEKLFFQTLNKPMNERSKYAPEFAHLIPYLNGGLFEPHSGDYYEEGFLGISRHANTLTLPDRWFKDLFQTLEMYNFTIDENTALDTDVSIDPEILGRIFENLLAEINPETGDSARKATGSFYTPREIVDYMVEESLLQHLKTALGLTTEHTENTEAVGRVTSPGADDLEQKLRALFVDDDEPHNLDDKTRRAVVNAFRTIKVLDPACGSGAFPVGILQKMLCALRKVDPENDLWLTAQIEQIHSMKLSKQEEDRRLAEIEHAFETNEADYGRKLGIIQNSVYGVDIQPIAIEISKLRFFLTLVVDEKINEKEDNRGILPLPNLDFKFVCANTLIPAPEIENKSGELGLEFKDPFFDDFTSLTEKYFYAGTPAEKMNIRQQLEAVVSKKVQSELNRAHDRMGGTNLFRGAHLSPAKRKTLEKEKSQVVRDARLWSSYKNIFTGETVGFFDPKYMFPDAAEGFDVVIANPPYIKEDENRDAFNGTRESLYYQGKMDIWYQFACIGLDLLINGRGLLCFIATNNWVTNDGASKLRQKISKEAEIVKLFDFGDYKIFENASIQTMVLCCQKKQISACYSFDLRRVISDKPSFLHVKHLINGIKQSGLEFITPTFDREQMKSRYFVFSQNNAEKILQKMDAPTSFKLASSEVFSGIDVLQDFVSKKSCAELSKHGVDSEVGNGVFVLSDCEAQSMKLNTSELKLLRPYYMPKHIWKWAKQPENEYWIIYTDSSFKDRKQMDAYPALRSHLDRYTTVITSVNAPYGLHRSREENLFKKGQTRILSLRKTEAPSFTLVRDDCYVSRAYLIIKTEKINSEYLVGVMNSSAVNFWLRQRGKVQGCQLQIDKEPLLSTPIPAATPAQQKEIEGLVEQILALKKKDPTADVSALEGSIDHLVYKLYNLTPEEVNIVEGRT